MKQLLIAAAILLCLCACDKKGDDAFAQMAQLAAIENANTARQEFDTDGDGNIDGAIYYNFNSQGFLSTAKEDPNLDGVIDNIAHYYYKNERSDRDEFDWGADGSIDEIVSYSYNEDNRLSRVDIEIHGKAVGATIYVYNDYNDRLNHTEKLDSSGAIISTTRYYYNTQSQDYSLDREEIDKDNDGVTDHVIKHEYNYSSEEIIKEDIDNDGTYDTCTKFFYDYYDLINRIEYDSNYNDNSYKNRAEEFYYFSWELINHKSPTSLSIIEKSPEDVSAHYNTPITVRFSSPLNKKTISDSAITISNGVPGAIDYTDTTISFIPEYFLEADTRYEVTVESGIQDLLGNSFWYNSWSFETLSFGIATQYPNRSESDVPIDSQIKLTFSGPIDESRIDSESLILTYNNSSTGREQVLGTISHTIDSITFTPAETLKYNVRYTVSLSSNVMSTTGKSISSYDRSWTFTAQPIPYQADSNTKSLNSASAPNITKQRFEPTRCISQIN